MKKSVVEGASPGQKKCRPQLKLGAIRGEFPPQNVREEL
jgi:hypothetical protein